LLTGLSSNARPRNCYATKNLPNSKPSRQRKDVIKRVTCESPGGMRRVSGLRFGVSSGSGFKV
jgi:hypothetical protein